MDNHIGNAKGLSFGIGWYIKICRSLKNVYNKNSDKVAKQLIRKYIIYSDVINNAFCSELKRQCGVTYIDYRIWCLSRFTTIDACSIYVVTL